MALEEDGCGSLSCGFLKKICLGCSINLSVGIKSEITSSSTRLHQERLQQEYHAGAEECKLLPEVRIGPLFNPVVDAEFGGTFRMSLQGLL